MTEIPKKDWNEKISECPQWSEELVPRLRFCWLVSWTQGCEFAFAVRDQQTAWRLWAAFVRAPRWTAFTGSCGPAASLNWRKKTSCHNNALPPLKGRETNTRLQLTTERAQPRHVRLSSTESMRCWRIPGVITAQFVPSSLIMQHRNVLHIRGHCTLTCFSENASRGTWHYLLAHIEGVSGTIAK